MKETAFDLYERAQTRVVVVWPGSEKGYTFASTLTVARKLKVSVLEVEAAANTYGRVTSGPLEGFAIAWTLSALL
jgi:hypothetical protein